MTTALFQDRDFHTAAQRVRSACGETVDAAEGLAIHAVGLADAAHDDLRQLITIRRKGKRLGALNAAERIDDVAVAAFAEGEAADARTAFAQLVHHLARHLELVEPLLVPALDEVIALNGVDGHPLQAGLDAVAAAVGFSAAEAAWLKAECAGVDWRLLDLMMAGDHENLRAMLRGALVTDGVDVAHLGFLRMTGDEDTDARLCHIVARCRAAGVTASLFHLWPIVLAATLVAAAPDAPEAAGNPQPATAEAPHLLAHFGALGFFDRPAN